ncbi:MAG: xanthine dehydrogenase family protein molybdopterin-binding subunit [Chloroflexi bacterium]|nr:xanthine dehydrogenase family protein molybdopterin-binding subunit [Chloroflexota bacterium]
MTTTDYRVIGQPVARADGPEKVTGLGKYSIDVVPPGTLWAKVLRSPYPHARVVRVDTSRALALPGVRAVLTGEDVRGVRTGKRVWDEPVLAWDRVLFIGDKVAAVAADDEETAEMALGLIVVEYEELPAVFGFDDTLAPGAPLLHPDFNSYHGVTRTLDTPSNRFAHDHWTKGDIEEGFRQADRVIERTYRTQRTHQAYLEPHSCVVLIDDANDDQIHVWLGTKSPFQNRNTFADAVGIPQEKVTIDFAHVGGDFGGKGDTTGVPICYYLAKATGRPVKLILDYSEELMAMNPRHESLITIRVGVKTDGTLTAWDSQIHFNSGAFAAYKPGPNVNLIGAREVAGPYRIPNVNIDAYQVYTNTVPGGFHRAPGEFQGIFAGESHMDIVAHELGIDPLELRMRNIIHDGDDLPTGTRYERIKLEEVLREAARASGYHDPLPANVGRGIAIGHRSQGGGESHVGVTIDPDGSIVANTSIFESGNGTYTLLRQVVAEELSVAPERVSVVPWTTDHVTTDMGVGGSRVSFAISQGGFVAAVEVRDKLRRLAAEFMGWTEERVSLPDGNLVNGSSGEAVPLERIVARSGQPVSGRADLNESNPNPHTSFVAQVAEVSVDPETGETKLLQLTAVHDSGRVINPIGFHGQIEGGIVQAIGQAVMEDLMVDEGGRVTNPSFADFKIPTMRDIPELRTVLVEENVGRGNYQVKGVGEHSNITTAMANAIEDAIGVRLYDLPLTSAKIWRALRDRT